MEIYDAYKLLGLEPKATQKDIQDAYRRLAKIWHPDINKSPEAEEKFKHINIAYEMLSKQQVPPQFANYARGYGFNPYINMDIDEIFKQAFKGQQGTHKATHYSLTLNLDGFSDGTAELIIEILAKNGIQINTYNVQSNG
jgi:DnaJ-class molecular chaperone